MGNNLDNLADQLAAEAGEGAVEETTEAKPTEEKDSGSDRNLALILDIPLRVAVELGRTKMPVSELLNLGQGSVIELNKLAGEPMEVLVNDKLIARGEAVVVNEKFGVRLTDIISPAERVEQLK
ncbi:MAG: flagellar motor switch protein FliN [Pseudobdellovibrionaceae bacterium]